MARSRRSLLRPLALGLGLGLAALAPLAAGCAGKAQADASAETAAAKAETKEAPTFPASEVAVATAVTVPEQLVVTGTIEPFDRADIVPDVSGKVIEVLVDRGSVVQAGDPLMKLDTRQAALSEKEARANLASLRAQQKLADDTCRRSKELLDKGAITQSEWERDQAQCAQARLNVSAASARLGKAGEALDDGVVRAPFAGTISERWVSLGEWASPQMKAFTLVDDHALRADLTLSEAASVHAKLGADVRIAPIAARDHVVHGTISRVGVEIDPKTRGLLVEVAIPKPAEGEEAILRPGMFVEAKLAVGELTLPAVPKAAVTKRGATWRVFAVVDDKLEERVVQLGPDAPGDLATIARGLAADEPVAGKVDETTADGATVR
ncbi:MAG: efflux RND transporter periplasmic adaptor subunit [Deltaproteobacteria bacterium]|nr:efflux RND transporter periplasmic adaptor subunit [Deltaproteobacteria bacterium]